MSIPTVTTVTPGAVLLDVREDDEWADGHAPDAVHIPLGELVARADEVPSDQPVVVICRAGGRSARATGFLRGRGVDASNYHGGMQAWAAAGGSMVSESGAPPWVS